MNQFPPSPRVFHLDHFKFFQKFTEIFAIQGANLSTSFASVVINDTGSEYASSFNDAGGKLPPVSPTPATNLPLVSFTPPRRQNNGRNYQTADKFKMNLKKQIYLYANSTTQRCPKEIIKKLSD
jgi:hypothetical protein